MMCNLLLMLNSHVQLDALGTKMCRKWLTKRCHEGDSDRSAGHMSADTALFRDNMAHKVFLTRCFLQRSALEARFHNCLHSPIAAGIVFARSNFA